MLVLAALGFASGLPSAYKVLGSTLQAWLIDLGRNLPEVTGITLVTLPIGLKVLWAPLLDRYAPPFLGRRRGWLAVFQAALAVGLGVMALVGPSHQGDPLGGLAVAALVVAFLSASQDVVSDAYRVDVVEPEERATGAAMYVNGYRIALLAAGSGALLLAEVLPWRAVYGLVAIVMALTVAATLAAEEPAGEATRPRTLRDAVVEPWRDLLDRLGKGIVVVVLFLALFRLPDALGNTLTMPLLQRRLAFSKAEIGLVRDGLGLAISIVGALAAGPLVGRWGVLRSLWIFGVLQAVSNLGFCLLATVGHDMALFVAVIAVENFCQGLVAAGFVAYLMGLCDRRYSATQYALFTGLLYLVGTLTGSLMGSVADAVGYVWAFALSALAGVPGLLLLLGLPTPALPPTGIEPPE
jgi:PAT family beta-lactamase induction signal transducer AmpG